MRPENKLTPYKIWVLYRIFLQENWLFYLRVFAGWVVFEVALLAIDQHLKK